MEGDPPVARIVQLIRGLIDGDLLDARRLPALAVILVKEGVDACAYQILRRRAMTCVILRREVLHPVAMSNGCGPRGLIIVTSLARSALGGSDAPMTRPMTHGWPDGEGQPRTSASVGVYTTGAPTQPFIEVGLVEAQQESAMSNDRQPQVLEKLRQRAAEVGCDGIVLLGSNDSVTGSISRGYGWTTTLQGYRATCIVFYQPW